MTTMRRLTARDVEDITAARTAAAGQRGRQLREDACLTIEEVARRISAPDAPVTRSAVGMWEAGDRVPRGSRALAYGRFLRQLADRAAADAMPAEAKAAS